MKHSFVHERVEERSAVATLNLSMSACNGFVKPHNICGHSIFACQDNKFNLMSPNIPPKIRPMEHVYPAFVGLIASVYQPNRQGYVATRMSPASVYDRQLLLISLSHAPMPHQRQSGFKVG